MARRERQIILHCVHAGDDRLAGVSDRDRIADYDVQGEGSRRTWSRSRRWCGYRPPDHSSENQKQQLLNFLRSL
jgi:hypothetical protein